MKKVYAFGLITFLATIVFQPSLNATTLVKVSVDDMAEQSHDVIIGTVEDVEPYWKTEENGKNRLHTIIYVKVERSLKSECGTHDGEIMEVHRIGGSTPGFSMFAIGGPKFALHSRVLLFVTLGFDGTHRLAGFSQGKFRLFRQQSQSGGYLCVQDHNVTGAHMLSPKTGEPVSTTKEDRYFSLGEIEGIVNDIKSRNRQ